MELDDAMRTTFAARQFTDDPVTDADLVEIFDVARFAPSGGNRQGGHVIVVRDQSTKDRLAELGKPGAHRYLAQRAAGEKPWNTIVPTALSAEEIAAAACVDDFVAPLAAAPVVLVVSVDLSVVASLDANLDRIGVVSGASVYPLVWNILLVARSRGFGGTITTVSIAEEPAIRDLLGLPDSHAVAAVIPLGRPVKQLTKLRRAAVEDFVTVGTFDGPPLRSR